MDSRLLATRLTIPPLAHHLIGRGRLIDALEQGLATAGLVLVSAPAGYGKTTLLAQWARATEHDVAWLTCSASYNDPGWFLRDLVSAWATKWPELREHRLGMLLGDVAPDLDAVLAALFDAAGATPRTTALVLDDFHLIDDPDIHRTLALLLDHMPPALHLVIATREDPPLPIARLRARRELLELRSEDMRLRRDELAAMLARASDVPLDVGWIDVLHARLEGWAAGAQLAALALRHHTEPPDARAISGRQRHIADYIRQEVLSALPAETRTFLLQTSILDRLSGPLCDRVTGARGGQEMLESLERANLFLLPLDDNRTWFRYHALFAEALRDELDRHAPQEVAVLHRRAADWYLEQELPEPAFDHAFAGDAADTVVEILDRYLTVKLFGGEARVATRWIESIPRAWYITHPQLLIERAAWQLLTGQRAAGIRTLDEAERRARTDTRDPTAARLSAMRCFIACFSNDLPSAEHYASQALDALPADDFDYRVNLHHALGDTYRGNGRWAEATAHYMTVLDLAQQQPRSPISRLMAVHVYGAMADLELRRGHMQRAAAFWTRAKSVVEAPEIWGRFPLPIVGWVYLRMGELAYEQNDLARARAAIERGIERAELGGDARSIIAGRVILARLELSAGEPEAAAAHLDAARRRLDETPFPDWTSRLERGRVELWLTRGDIRAASTWCEAMLASGELEHRADAEPAWAAIARVLIQRGDPEALTLTGQVLDRLVDAARDQGRTGVLIEALALRALAFERRGNRTAALTDLARALRLAEPEGYIRLFIDLGTPMRWLLGEARKRAVMPEVVSPLIAAFGEPAGDGPPPLAEQLTGRERDVVQLLATGLTNREIAEALYVSPETIKKHVGSIFGKLGVRNRVEAVARARSLAIIE